MFFACFSLASFCRRALFGARRQASCGKLIPEPKQVEATRKIFVCKPGMRVSLADSRSTADRFAAQDFIDDVATNRERQVCRSAAGRNIVIGSLAIARIKREFETAEFRNPGESQ